MGKKSKKNSTLDSSLPSPKISAETKFDNLENAVSVAMVNESQVSDQSQRQSRKNRKSGKQRASDGFNANHRTVDVVLAEERDNKEAKRISAQKASKRKRKRKAKNDSNATYVIDESYLNGVGESGDNNIFNGMINKAKRRRIAPFANGFSNGTGANSVESSDVDEESDHEDEEDLDSSAISIEDLAIERKTTRKSQAPAIHSSSSTSANSGGSFQDKLEFYDQNTGARYDLNSSEESGESLGPMDSDIDDEDTGFDDELDDEENSFIVDDEELEEFSDEDEGDEDISLNSVQSEEPFECSIHGFTTSANTPNCVVLCADAKTKEVDDAFRLFKFSSDVDQDSTKSGLNALRWMIAPFDNQTFFKEIYQKRALVVKRKNCNYYDGFFDTNDFVEMLQKHNLEFGKNVNVAFYKDGVRTTHNVDGRVYPGVLQDHFARGRSVQCVNPQSYNDHLWYLCDVLQEVFCSFVGANNYITPANSEGFAPHWDDVDAFLLQVEGRKHWKILAPLADDDKLPIVSSENFTDDIFDSDEREVVFDGVLEQGDVLYIPRGYIHKAHTSCKGAKHSHHVTVSVCRQFAFTDLLRKGIPDLLEKVTSEDVRLRASLPPLVFDMSGVAEIEYPSEESFIAKVEKPCKAVMKKLARGFQEFCPGLIDKMVVDFLRVALPPLLDKTETNMSCMGTVGLLNHIPDDVRFHASSKVRLIRRHAQRLVFGDENTALIIHRMENSRFYDDSREEASFDFPLELEELFLKLVDAYPNWIEIGELVPEKKAKKLLKLLYKHCLLLVDSAESTPLSSPLTDQNPSKAKGVDSPNKKRVSDVECNGMEPKKSKKKKRKAKNKSPTNEYMEVIDLR